MRSANLATLLPDLENTTMNLLNSHITRMFKDCSLIAGLLAIIGFNSIQVHASTTLSLGLTVPAGSNEYNPSAVLNWTAQPNSTYKIQSATDLSQPSPWTTEDVVKSTGSRPLTPTSSDNSGLYHAKATAVGTVIPRLLASRPRKRSLARHSCSQYCIWPRQ